MKSIIVVIIFVLIYTLTNLALIAQNDTSKSVFRNPCEIYNSSIIMNEKVRVINLGPNVNSPKDDYAPTLTMDGKIVLFCSNKDGSIPKLNNKSENSHDFWLVEKANRLDTVFQKSVSLSTYDNGLINSPMNEGAASLSADGRMLYLTGCQMKHGYGDCDIYATIFTQGHWIEPILQGENLNSAYFDSQPSIGPYNRRIYFVSTRPGPNSDGYPSKDNMDIWYCDWDTTKWAWGKAINIEEINTNKQEVSPFIAADGVTLFFASAGHSPNYGGLDFYVTRYDIVTKKWSKPKNLGKPINSDKDEMFINVPVNGDVLYFSSNRDDIPGYQGGLDLYMCYLPDYKNEDECLPSEASTSNIMYDGKTGDFLIEYTMSIPGQVIVSVFDVYGNKLAELENSKLEAGTYFNQWKTISNNKQIYKSGMYLFNIKITTDNKTYDETKKMMLLNPIKQ